MMQSKVKPLHAKVAETSSTEATAMEKMTTMNDKLTGLEDRLKALALAYEDASIDKCRQYELTQTLDTKLKQAAYFEEVTKNISIFFSRSLFHLSLYSFIFLFILLFIHLPIHLSIHSFFLSFIYLFIYSIFIRSLSK